MKTKPLTEKEAQRLAALMNRAIEHEQLCLSRETEVGVTDGISRGPDEWEACSFVPDPECGDLPTIDLIMGSNSVESLAGLSPHVRSLQNLLSACADMLVCIRDTPDFHAEQRKAARALMDYGVVRVCNQDLSVDAEAGL